MARVRSSASLVAYLVFAAVVIVALVGYQRHVNSHFSKDNRRFVRADAQSCLNRRILIKNQRLVLSVLERNIGEFIRSAKTDRQRTYFAESLARVMEAEALLDRTPRC